MARRRWPRTWTSCRPSSPPRSPPRAKRPPTLTRPIRFVTIYVNVFLAKRIAQRWRQEPNRNQSAPRQLQHDGQHERAGQRAAPHVTEIAAQHPQHRRFSPAQHEISNVAPVCPTFTTTAPSRLTTRLGGCVCVDECWRVARRLAALQQCLLERSALARCGSQITRRSYRPFRARSSGRVCTRLRNSSRFTVTPTFCEV